MYDDDSLHSSLTKNIVVSPLQPLLGMLRVKWESKFDLLVYHNIYHDSLPCLSLE